MAEPIIYDPAMLRDRHGSPRRRLYPPACKPYGLEAEPEAHGRSRHAGKDLAFNVRINTVRYAPNGQDFCLCQFFD